MKKFICILMMAFCMPFAFTQDAAAPRSTAIIIQEMRDNEKRMADYVEELKSINNDKDETIESLMGRVSTISEKLEAALKDEAEANTTIVKQNIKLRLLTKWLIIVVSILGTFVLLHGAIMFIKLKWGITLPYWLNTIL